MQQTINKKKEDKIIIAPSDISSSLLEMKPSVRPSVGWLFPNRAGIFTSMLLIEALVLIQTHAVRPRGSYAGNTTLIIIIINIIRSCNFSYPFQYHTYFFLPDLIQIRNMKKCDKF